MEFYEANKENPNILLRFLETKYVSKNTSIRETFDYVFSHPVINYDELKSLHTSAQARHSWNSDLECKDYQDNYALLLDYIKKYNWKGVDTLFYEQYNVKEHFRIIFALLTKWYYHDRMLSRLQYENALGIQQARWAMSPENKFRQYLFNGIKGLVQNIEFSLVKNVGKFPYAIDVPKQLQWCFYQQSKNKIVYTVFLSYDIYHMGIPETFDLSKCAPVYRPRLVCGTFNSCSLMKFMKSYGERPFICHHPDLSDKHNSVQFDGIQGVNVFEHWAHDARHVLTNLQGVQDFGLNPQTLTEQECLRYNDEGLIYNTLHYQEQKQQTQQHTELLLSQFAELSFDDQLSIIKKIKQPLDLYSFLLLKEFCEPIMPFIYLFRSINVSTIKDFDSYVFSVYSKSFPMESKDFNIEKAIRLLCDAEYVNYYKSFMDKLLSKQNVKTYLGKFLDNFKNHLDLFEKAAQSLNKVDILEKIQLLKQKLI